MAKRTISVEILGDSTSLEKAFVTSAKAAQRFNQQLGGSQIARSLDTQTKAVRGITAAEEELIEVRSRRASSLGPFRVSGVGLAAGLGLFAATQAARELSGALETTGEAAFKTEGRIKNMVAALTSGNLVGAITALTRVPQTIEEAGLSLVASTERMKAMEEIARGFPSVLGDVGGSMTALSREQAQAIEAITATAGTNQKKIAEEFLKTVGALKTASVATQALDDWVNRLGDTFTTQTGAVVKFTGALDDLDRARGPGGVALEALGRPAGMPTLPPLSPSQRRELDLIGKEALERIPLLQDRLRQLQNQMEDFHGNQEQRLKTLTNIKNTEAEIAAIYSDQAAKRRADAEDAKREAEAARARAEQEAQRRIATRMGWLDFGIEKAEATKGAKDDLKAYRAVEAMLQERIRQEGRQLDLVRDLWRIREKIKGAGKGQVDPIAGLRLVDTGKMARLLAAGTGLGGRGLKRLGSNIAGAHIQPIYTTVVIDGREVGRAVTNAQAKTGKRTAKQTSGRRG